MENVVPVILSGGSGSRLWPKSRKAYPKQLHRLYGDATMLQHTVKRVDHLGAPIVVCNNDQRFMVADQLQETCGDASQIILEPIGRNTAPAIAVAAMRAIQQVGDKAIIVILAADHLIKDMPGFRATLDIAIKKATEGKLVTFGVVPTHPETGYGYIKAAEPLAGNTQGATVAEFVEKPNLETAQKYLAEGSYTWNSGMFVFPAKTLLEELTRLNAELVKQSQISLDKSEQDLDFIRLNEQAFAQCQDISIDNALMEHTNKAWVVPLNAGWSDLGSWQSLWESSDKDEQGNVVVGDAYMRNCTKSLIHSDGRLVAAIGLDDVVIIDSDDALLVVNKNKTQDVKHVVDWLKANNRSESQHHREVHRPWGSYDSIDSGERYDVKSLKVKPGASLSLQMHHHRAEHWVVVRGTAQVERGDEKFLVTENESVYIPLGEPHRLTNPGKVPLYLVEVRSGEYLGEDDIVRL